jgi:predicted DsbA family dithiol-disulfide isomerase
VARSSNENPTAFREVTRQQNSEVEVFGDYLDPSTRAACAAVTEAGGTVRFRHLPLRSGLAAAVAAEAARELGAFEPMHERLLRHEGAVQTEDLRRYAREAGLDADRFEEVFGSDAQMERLRADVEAAGTKDPPALFHDGERLPTYSVDWLRERLATG